MNEIWSKMINKKYTLFVIIAMFGFWLFTIKEGNKLPLNNIFKKYSIYNRTENFLGRFAIYNTTKKAINNLFISYYGYKGTPITKERALSNNMISFELTKYILPHDIGGKFAYIEKYDDYFIIVFRSGEIFYFNENNLVIERLQLNAIKNNIKNYTNWYGVHGVAIIDNYIYLTYTMEIEDDCYNNSIIRSRIDFSYLTFEEFFSYDECNSDNAPNIGGRIVKYKKGQLLFTVGDYSTSERKENFSLNSRYKWNTAQDDNSLFGKIVSLNMNNKQYEIFSKGHRNPQGLFYVDEDDIILSTEHGPRGGDEINEIIRGGNYGWPIASYGTHYIPFPETPNWEPLLHGHNKYGYIEPIIDFTPSIGISEIIKTKSSIKNPFGNTYFLATLSGLTLYSFQFNVKKNKLVTSEELATSPFQYDDEFYIQLSNETMPGPFQVNDQKYTLESHDKIMIGERIRDIIFMESQNIIIMVIEGPEYDLLGTTKLAVLGIID